jgi:rfaE bifunctional protein kinase chain/domain
MNYQLKNNSRLLVIGDVMLDHYLFGHVDRISPEAPVPVVAISKEEYSLGGAGNVLKNSSALGAQAGLLTVTGDDPDGEHLSRLLAGHGFDRCRLIKDTSRCTTVKTRVLAVHHQMIRLDRETTHPVSEVIGQQLLVALEQTLADYDLVLLSDYHKGLLTEDLLRSIFSFCRRAGIPTILDPKGTDFSKYRGVNLIKPNKKEAALATGINISDEASLLAACKKIVEITGCDSVVITLSEDGMAIYSEGQLSLIPTRALGVVDVTGAGDTVLAALGTALASGNSLVNACDFANHAAAVVVSKLGSATATLDEINQIAPETHV